MQRTNRGKDRRVHPKVNALTPVHSNPSIARARFPCHRKVAVPQMRDQFPAHVGCIEAQLGDGREWLLGEFSLADVNACMNIWYTRSNLSDADQDVAHLDVIFARLPHTVAWDRRVRDMGMALAPK